MIRDHTQREKVGLSLLVAAVVMASVPQTISAAPPVLTDEQLLDQTQARAARYFWDQVLGNGFVRDATGTAHASIAATGFGLAVLAVIAERYDSSVEWTITPAQARARAEQILDAAITAQDQQGAHPELYGRAGFLYHFIVGDLVVDPPQLN